MAENFIRNMENVNENVAYYSSLTGMGELLKNGCTTCLDHHYVFPKGHNKGILDAQFAAADALGIRSMPPEEAWI